jgi:hypothetical protein
MSRTDDVRDTDFWRARLIQYLVADFDVPVTTDPLGDGREQLLDTLPLGGRLDHADPVGVLLSPQVAPVGS